MRRDLNELFGHRVRERRHQLGLTLDELAKLTASSRAYLNQVELGRKNVSLVKVIEIAKALDVDATSLLT